MDWRDLLDERNRREQARRLGRLDTGNVTTQQPQEDRGFFGNIGKTVSDIGGFFGNIAGDLAEGFIKPAAETVEKIGSTLTAGGKKQELDEKLRKGEITQQAYNEQIKEIYAQNVEKKVVEKDGQVSVEKKNPIEFAQGFFGTGADLATTYAPFAKGASVALKGTEKLKDVAMPLLKEGAAYGGLQTGADVLNEREVTPESVATNLALGVGGSALGYGAAKGIKNLGDNARTAAAQTAAKNVEVQSFPANKLTSYEGAPDRARVDFYKQRIQAGEPIDPIIAIKDSSGALGVEDGKHKLQAYLESGIDNVPTKIVTREQLKAITQGGYVQLPGGNSVDEAAGGADLARRQLDGEDVSAAINPADKGEEIAQSIAAQYKSADDYITQSAKIALDGEKTKGVSLVPDGQAYGYGKKRVSDHAPWYGEMYKQTGGKPSLRAVRDRVEEALATGKDGGGLVHPEEARVYQLLKDRDAGFEQTLTEGPPLDMAGQFADNLGLPAAKTSRATPRAGIPAGLPKGPQPGQQPLVEAADPYAGFAQDLGLPALPQGEIAKPLSPRQAVQTFGRTGEAPEFVNTMKPGKEPIALPATTDELSSVAARQTKSGKVKPLKYTSNEDVEAIRAIAADDTGSAFTATRTPELNLEEALAKRGGVGSKEFRVLDKFNTSIREHTADLTNEVQGRRDFMERFIKEFGINGKNAQAMRPYLEAADPNISSAAYKAYSKKFGEKAAEGMARLRTWWRAEKDAVRNETNAIIEQYAGKNRIMGDLGETYVPRVYRTGKAGFKDSVLDVVHAGMDKIGGKKGLFNLADSSGYLSKETETMGALLRNPEGIPLNSEFAKPATTYLSAAQKRTANTPIKDLEDPLTSMMRYFEATAKSKHLTPDIAKGQELRDVIEMVNGETGNLRQMYKAFEDQINAVAGKTSRIDRPIVDSKAGSAVVGIATKLQSRIAKSTILGSASSAVAQTGQLPLIVAENGANNFRKAMQEMVFKLTDKADDPFKKSSLMASRYPKNQDPFAVKKSTRAAQTATDVVAKPFRIIERAASELAWRSSYNKAAEAGLTGKEAVREADRITAKIIGERTAGARAALYESKALGPITAYTLEVNQMYQVAKQYFKRDRKKALKLVAAIWLYNQGYKAVTGNKLNADPAEAAMDIGGILTDQDTLDDEGKPIGIGERLVRSAGRAGGELLDATPLGNSIAGQVYPEQGFRVPFGGGERTLSRNDIFGDTSFGRYGGGTPIASGISNPLLLLGIPGMGQVQRSVEGNEAFQGGASLTPTGRTRFNIEQDPENYWRAILFGMYNTKEGRAYLEAQNARLAGQKQQGSLRY